MLQANSRDEAAVEGGRELRTARSFARRAYGGVPTLVLAVEPDPVTPASTREADAPIYFQRHTTELSPSACHAASRRLAAEEHDLLLERDLTALLAARLDETSEVEVFVLGDCVMLSGTVSCPLVKLLAEDLIYSIPTVRDCDNGIVVRGTHGKAIAA